jgi:uncharacterized protein
MLMLAIAALMFWKGSGGGNVDVRLTRATASTLMPFLLVYGIAVGMLSGFFGIGGGFLIVPALMAATGMSLIFAIGSSLVSVTAFGMTTAANYALSGLIDWTLVALFIVGGIAGGGAGQLLSRRLASHKQALSHTFAAVVAVVGCYVIWRGLNA